jgi:hypothetical protein
MTTINEIEAAIEGLPPRQVEELADWLQKLRVRRGAAPAVESWLERARGGAVPGATTDRILAMTRGEG